MVGSRQKRSRVTDPAKIVTFYSGTNRHFNGAAAIIWRGVENVLKVTSMAYSWLKQQLATENTSKGVLLYATDLSSIP